LWRRAHDAQAGQQFYGYVGGDVFDVLDFGTSLKGQLVSDHLAHGRLGMPDHQLFKQFFGEVGIGALDILLQQGIYRAHGLRPGRFHRGGGQRNRVKGSPISGQLLELVRHPFVFWEGFLLQGSRERRRTRRELKSGSLNADRFAIVKLWTELPYWLCS
jgi:hypothetical protein